MMLLKPVKRQPNLIRINVNWSVILMADNNPKYSRPPTALADWKFRSCYTGPFWAGVHQEAAALLTGNTTIEKPSFV